MNILGLVFSLLLILSFSFFASWEKQNGSSRLQSTYIGHQKVQRKILKHYESELYATLRQTPHAATELKPEKRSTPGPDEELSLQKSPLNQECAQLNLWPLIQDGREEHPILYETAAKLLRTFYTPLFEKKARFEYPFLDQLLKAAKESLEKQSPFEIEKIAFRDPYLQMLFYKMLKGTKEWDLVQGMGYPSLMDYIKFDRSKEKICLFHAHPDLIAVLFGFKAAPRLYAEMHKENPPPLTKELIENICGMPLLLDPDFLALLELGRPSHKKSSKITFIAEDPQTHVALRRTLYLNSDL